LTRFKNTVELHTDNKDVFKKNAQISQADLIASNASKAEIFNLSKELERAGSQKAEMKLNEDLEIKRERSFSIGR